MVVITEEQSNSSSNHEPAAAATTTTTSHFSNSDSELRQRRREVTAPSSQADGDNQKEKKREVESDPEPTITNPSGGGDEFSCNICFDTASNPVLTMCGHLFCWSCLVQWLERSGTCPVCKSGCDKDKVIPVYGRGKEEKDPRIANPNLPNRPAGQRAPPPARQPNQFFGFDPFGVPGSFHGVGGRTGGGGAVFVGGFGILPALMGFSSFSSSSSNNSNGGTQQSSTSTGGGAGRNPTTSQQQQQAFASRVLMMLAAMILMSILFY